MNRLTVKILAACAALSACAPVALAAQTPTPPPYVPPPYVAATADPTIPVFDDASIHFAAPKNWRRIDLPPNPDLRSQPIVGFLEDKKYDATSIGISIEPYDDILDRFNAQHEDALKKSGGFIEHRAQVTLANGMPAYFVQSSSGDDISATRRFEYVVVDGKRGIIVTLVSRRGVVDEATARRDLAPLAVVLYPQRG